LTRCLVMTISSLVAQRQGELRRQVPGRSVAIAASS
jgi:hypothetical protein